MNLLAVSPESDYADEAACVVRLFENGLRRYHLRKPGWTADQTAGFIGQLPGDLQSRISIHQHHELADTFSVGRHHKAGAGVILTKPTAPAAVSRSLHTLSGLEDACQGMDYVFLSPVFPSISKPGYAPDESFAALRSVLSNEHSANVYALGGLDINNFEEALELGFDGVVLHGALWLSADPVKVLAQFGRVAA